MLSRLRKSTVPKRVLVVEDDAILAMAIEAALVDAGVETVRLVASTADALAALRDDKPDLMVLDVHLADRNDGWALAELVDTIGPNPPRVIFSTGAPGDIPPEIAGLGSILEKPYAPEELAALACTPAGKPARRRAAD